MIESVADLANKDCILVTIFRTIRYSFSLDLRRAWKPDRSARPSALFFRHVIALTCQVFEKCVSLVSVKQICLGGGRCKVIVLAGEKSGEVSGRMK